jgi:hypothetical protein
MGVMQLGKHLIAHYTPTLIPPLKVEEKPVFSFCIPNA